MDTLKARMDLSLPPIMEVPMSINITFFINSLLLQVLVGLQLFRPLKKISWIHIGLEPFIKGIHLKWSQELGQLSNSTEKCTKISAITWDHHIFCILMT